jgi:hypothetical protein
VKYAAEMDSGAMIYLPNFLKNDSAIQNLFGVGDTHRQHGDRISLLSLFFLK